MPASIVPTVFAAGPKRDWRSWPLQRAHIPALMLAAGAGVALLALWPAAAAGRHMLLHVVTMSAIAPIAVGSLRRFCGLGWHTRALHLWLATVLQLGVFLYWHSPAGMTLAMHAPAGNLLLQGSLLTAAGLFWWCIAGLGAERAWHAIAALLVTGKLFCLVAVILTFAPRPLYHMMTLTDQQLAGLIMITLCPLTYIASALWLCRRWLMCFDAPASS